MSGKKYIYNMRQANFYIEHGARCIGVGKHNGTGNTYLVFDFNETKDVYLKWLKHCEEYKASQTIERQ